MAVTDGRRGGEPEVARDERVRARRGERLDDRAVYIISVAAELAGVHPQTLRMYERRGLLRPKRTSGNTRRYSERDIERIRTIQQLTQQEGISLSGVRLFMAMREQLEEMQRRAEELERELRRRASAPPSGTEILPLRSVLEFRWQEGTPG